jgi:hypothetical protein
MRELSSIEIEAMALVSIWNAGLVLSTGESTIWRIGTIVTASVITVVLVLLVRKPK